MRYRTNEAIVNIPDGWYDQTLHIFSSEKPGQPGYTLVITSELLDGILNSEGYRDMALKRLPKELPGLNLLKEKPTSVMSSIPCFVLEYTWNSQSGIMHHFQALFAISQQGKSQRVVKGYSITMSVSENLFRPESEKLFIQTLRSYQFDQ